LTTINGLEFVYSGKFETFKQRDITKQKRPNSVEVMTGPSSELPTKRFKSILPNDKKSNIVMSTQGNIVLMGQQNFLVGYLALQMMVVIG
jgi:hypothetical protein